ncbi:MAG: histidinol dehydrogenase [Proteobacteria bacterium]|nr:histidinol dehydrogenase [Pseudomonadota bacterium]
MRIIDWSLLDPATRRAALQRPRLTTSGAVVAAAKDIIAAVRAGGDRAVRELTRRFDGIDLEDTRVTAAEFAAARSTLAAADVAALERALANVRRFHAAQRPAPFTIETEPGVRCEQLVRPLERVGLYVPAGSAPLPSAAIMLGVPAALAGCPVKILCTPARRDGSADPSVLVAARLCGVEDVHKVGGAQAIAALAYGTGRIGAVDKIFGPGNAYVTAAKQLVASDPEGAACDLPAGPSEVLVIADETARPAFVAADLLAQSEHDALSQAILVTDSRPLAGEVADAIARVLPTLTRQDQLGRSLQHCRALVVPDLDTALDIANAYAPEHLLLQVREPRRWLGRVRHAGSVFLGDFAPETLGDYCSGTNHVLPTYGHARALSGLTVRDFMKTISVQEVSADGLRSLGPCAVRLAGLEGLDAHAQAVQCRLEYLEGTRP